LEGHTNNNAKPSLHPTAFESQDQLTCQIINLFLPKERVPAPKVNRRHLFTPAGITNLLKAYTILSYFSKEYINILVLQSVAFLPVASMASSVLARQGISLLPEFCYTG